MEAIFFTACRPDALSVVDCDHLPSEAVSDPLRIQSPAALVALSKCLCPDGKLGLEPLRDATCRSFPVWGSSAAFSRAIVELADAEIDGIAADWLQSAGSCEMDADLHELAVCLEDLRSALRGLDGSGERLFVLLEEKAF